MGVLLLAVRAEASPPIAEEYHVKAAFLFNFTQFFEWPDAAFANDGAPFVIGVLGSDPFGRILDETVRGEKIKGRRVVVRRFGNAREVDHCNLLYVAKGAPASLEEIVALQRRHGILTVGEGDNFAKRGGVIRFYMESNRVRFGINVEAARDANLNVSSKLLRHAEIEPSSYERYQLTPTMYAVMAVIGG
jgi:hypothetical protein